MDSQQLLTAISKDLPSGTSVRVRLPYTEAVFEFDRIPTITFLYLKEHKSCIESSFDHVEGNDVVDAKLVMKCVGEELYYENV